MYLHVYSMCVHLYVSEFMFLLCASVARARLLCAALLIVLRVKFNLLCCEIISDCSAVFDYIMVFYFFSFCAICIHAAFCLNYVQ